MPLNFIEKSISLYEKGRTHVIVPVVERVAFAGSSHFPVSVSASALGFWPTWRDGAELKVWLSLPTCRPGYGADEEERQDSGGQGSETGSDNPPFPHSLQ